VTIRVVVFDVAGTTVDDGGAVPRLLQAALERAGVSVRPAAIEGVMGLGKVQALRTLLEGHGREDLLEDVGAIHADFVARFRKHTATEGGIRTLPGVDETFAALRAADVAVALDTGFPRELLDAILERTGWREGVALSTTVASDEVPRGRPYPDMIDAIRSRLGGIPAAQVAKVGDTPADLQEGTMARCGLVVGVASGRFGREALAEHPHDMILDGVADLPEALRERGLI
jgi:phosphonatase-like hydrolase